MRDRLVLLFGGTSTERRVSVASAQNLAALLAGAEPWFLAPDGAVHVCPAPALMAHERPFEHDFTPPSPARWPSIAAALAAAPAEAVLVLALHGGEGENGVLQRQMEERGLAFTGSGSAASALAFDKAQAKEAVARRGVSTAQAFVVRGAEGEIREALVELFRARGRLVVKPVADGSSIGLHHVTSAASIEAVARAVALSGVPYLAEDFVEGVELTVGVLEEEGGAVTPLPPSEVRLERGRAFDFAGKYLGKGTVEITPAEVPVEVATAAQQVALLAHTSIGCEGYSRTDVIVGERGVTFLEINTLPGLTRASFIPQQLHAAGRKLDAFMTTQIQLAQARRARRRAAA